MYLSLGFKLKDFLRENETLSTFLQQNASFSQNFVKNILEADVNLEKVSIILKKKKHKCDHDYWNSPISYMLKLKKDPNLTSAVQYLQCIQYVRHGHCF